MTETRPEESPTATPTPAPPPTPSGLVGWLTTGDHKRVGRSWLVVALVHSLAALVAGAVVGAERVDSGFDILSAGTFTQALSFHAVSAVFLFLLPVWIGLGTYLVPLQVGARTLAFPRAAALAFWTHLVAGGVLVGAYLADGGPGGTAGEAVELWTTALALVVVAWLVAAGCIVVTVFGLRREGMSLDRVPLFSWSMLVAGLLWLLTAPVLLAGLLLLYLDVRYGAGLLQSDAPVRLFLLQPQGYLLALPAVGVAAEVIPVLTGVRQAGHRVAMVAIAALGVLGVGAFVQPLGGVEVALVEGFGELWTVVSWLVLLPVLVLAALWADDLRRGRLRLDAPLLFAVGLLVLLLGAVAAGALATIDRLALFGTTWMSGQAHLLYLGAGGCGVLGALHYWGPKVWGARLHENGGRLAAAALVVGAGLLGVADLVNGALDLPAGAVTSDDGATVALAGVALAGGLLALLAVVIAIGNIAAAVGRAGAEPPGDDPWGGHTLEWATSSPPPAHNFTTVPAVTSERPLLDGDGGAGADSEEATGR